MNDVETPTGYALIKRSAWLGMKISLFVLAPICVLCWLVLLVPIVYKSASLGMSPLEFIRAVDALSPSDTPTHLSRIVGGLIAAVGLVVVGVLSSAVTGAVIGAATAGVQSLRARRSRPND
jgi:hypothetical protein